MRQPLPLNLHVAVSFLSQKRLKQLQSAFIMADGVDFTPAARKEIAQLESLGFGGMPVCMAKTQYSFSDDASKLGAPRDFRITVRQGQSLCLVQALL